jgi:Zn-dependent M28 family amino/carboxypeptidase
VKKTSARAALLALALPLAGVPAAALAQSPAPAPTLSEVTASEKITAGVLRAHGRFLSSDLTEGRGPGTRGDALARAYVAAQLEALGLEPAAPEGGFFQRVPLVGVETRVVAPPVFGGGKGAMELPPQDFVARMGGPTEAVKLSAAELVFVGHGIVAPEFEWNDYAGVDVKGKVVVVMNDDPSGDPEIFGGKRRLYYGRWTYKYEEAARQGAAAAIVIHTAPSASHPWSAVQTSWAGPQYELPDEPEPRLEARFWTTEDASRRIAALGGHDLDALREAAGRRGFRAVPLGVRLSVGLQAEVTRVQTANVVARLPGRDPRRAGEAVLVTAHLDHLGTKDGVAPGDDPIFNGAVDNASGVAGLLAAARAAAALPRRPARTLVFAALGAEEQGLLGSAWLVRKPPVPVGRIAAVVNLDGMNVFGRTRDVTLVGLGKSSLDDLLVPLARWQGRVVKDDPFPEKGSFFRSGHFSFAKAGVPSAYLQGGTDYVDQAEGWGEEVLARWIDQHYHQPSDQWNDDWDLSGMVEDARLAFFLAVKAAEARDMPRWRKGDEFEGARQRALRTSADASR